MKKLLLPILAILLLASCKKEITEEKVPAVNTKESSGVAARNANVKIDICHREGNGSFHTINININALPAHLTHGDIVPDADGDGYTKVNPCGVGSQDDCNDNDATINQGAEEICENNIDDNCNVQVDENCTEVTICNQTWMLKNLDVSTYRDGTTIPQVTDATAWASLTTGAWCYYENISANGTTYGKLYNWYAVAGIHDNDPNTPNKELAPAGWHVPTDAEWTVLSDCLGGSEVAGGKMKTTGTIEANTGLWFAPNTDATNSSGFTGLPGGARTEDGNFFGVGVFGYWWSSTEYFNDYALYSYLLNNSGFLYRDFFGNKLGFSVRCLRD
jgi:uncharacterized protein (TIGR02145 family)